MFVLVGSSVIRNTKNQFCQSVYHADLGKEGKAFLSMWQSHLLLDDLINILLLVSSYTKYIICILFFFLIVFLDDFYYIFPLKRHFPGLHLASGELVGLCFAQLQVSTAIWRQMVRRGRTPTFLIFASLNLEFSRSVNHRSLNRWKLCLQEGWQLLLLLCLQASRSTELGANFLQTQASSQKATGACSSWGSGLLTPEEGSVFSWMLISTVSCERGAAFYREESLLSGRVMLAGFQERKRPFWNIWGHLLQHPTDDCSHHNAKKNPQINPNPGKAIAFYSSNYVILPRLLWLCRNISTADKHLQVTSRNILMPVLSVLLTLTSGGNWSKF